MSETSVDAVIDGLEGDCLDVAEPFRFNFEIAWEVAHKGMMQKGLICLLTICCCIV